MKYVSIMIILSIVFSYTYSAPRKTSHNPSDMVIFKALQPLTEVLYTIDNKYVQNREYENPIQEAIKAFIKCLDSHSDFMDPKTFSDILASTQGEFGGVGIIIDNNKKTDDDSLLIVDVLPKKPAEKTGIRAHDRIVQVNNAIVKGMSIDEITAKLKGKAGSSVEIKIVRNNSPELLTFTVTRELIQEQNALCYHFEHCNIYYLALNMFTENSVKQLQKLLKQCQNDKSKGLILDLRNNSGGLLSAVIDIAGLFFKRDTLLIVTKDRNNAILEKYYTTKDPIAHNKIPIFILTNNYTASAAEILAGRLQQYSDSEQNGLLVFIVGGKTFGKGSVQEIIPMTNGCALKLTTALYYFPDDTSIQGTGIQPDFPLDQYYPQTQDMIWFNTFFGHESTLKNSIKAPSQASNSAQKNNDGSWEERQQQQISADYTILSTVRLIEMLHMARLAYPDKTTTRDGCLKLLKHNYCSDNKIIMKEIKI